MSDDRIATTIFLVRHGETEWNVTGRIQGFSDSALTPLGKEQGRRAAERLACEQITAVYASPAGRAQDTAALIAAPHRLPIETRDDLRERCYGDYEGETISDLVRRDHETVAAWLADRQRLAPPNGETQADLARRVMRALNEIARRHPGGKVAVATHGGPVKSILFSVLQVPIDCWQRTWVTNGSISIIRGEPGDLRIACFNDTCHLDSVVTPPKGFVEG